MSLWLGTNWRKLSSYLVRSPRCACATRDPEDRRRILVREDPRCGGPERHRPLDRGQRPGEMGIAVPTIMAGANGPG